MLKLAADLDFLDEPADQLGFIAMLFEQALDGQIAADVGIAPLEHGAHAAMRDLAEDLEPGEGVGRLGHLG